MQSLMPPIDSSDSLFHNGNPLTGEKGTIVTADFLNNTQSAIRDAQTELIAVLTAAGMKPDSASAGQLLTSLKKLFLIRSNPFSDIAAEGAAAVTAALTNLGLGDGTALPFGVPIPWPVSTPPSGWITMSGQTITKAQYPKLFALYGATLPDLRGNFIRGWDNGRGTTDTGRALLSQQTDAIRNIVGTLAFSDDDSTNYATALGGGVFARAAGTNQSFTGTTGNPSQVPAVLKFDASTVVPTAADNRPQNIAFNYIVRGI